MEAGSVPIEVPLRTQERTKLERYVPQIVDYLEGIGLNEKAEELDDVAFTIEENIDGRTRWLATTTADEWRTVLADLSNLDTTGVWWLRKKLAKRVHDRIDAVTEEDD